MASLALRIIVLTPNLVGNDISKGSFGIKKVKQTFAGAYDMMLQAIYTTAEILGARQDSRYVDLRRGSTLGRRNDEMSVLSTILAVDQETINHRRLVQEVYEQGKLARMLGIDPLSELNVSTQPHLEKRAREVESVASAWGEADMSESGEEGEVIDGPNGHQREAVDSESRYDISANRNGSVWKRRRLEGKRNGHAVSAGTIFVPEVEEDDMGNDIDHDEPINFYVDPDPADNSSDGLDEIERAYTAAADALAGSDEDSAYLKGNKGKGRSLSKAQKPLSAELRRAYWAAKSMQEIDMDSE